ncbi:uncharacterized protein TRIADDRAFT_55298 [Trichoplax adhaerens]|uniref:5-aminolevulinate synthase n=1 Tax=Trichoplax adhaerens TaxID=10228 RepID=B3RUI1_TRIAD|nr:hypothetical protein TRIADDRAFT_55298 [Trichoplax adhaerens]EDV25337.1 hypothetical protein TRIADDRAFT_55298 [Trichoplax adhaerens]|eukprot:XP_002111370.1 hypothetical protein TRIADDRAFT_55298 [Trichoplax adhaerens]
MTALKASKEKKPGDKLCFDKDAGDGFKRCPFLGHSSRTPFGIPYIKSAKIVDASNFNNQASAHMEEVYFSGEHSENSSRRQGFSNPNQRQSVDHEYKTTREPLFSYNQFFNDQIELKKKNHTYRIFKEINRSATTFPLAKCHLPDQTRDEITVWCSNDYLGLSRHPKVISAVTEALKCCGTGAGGTRNISGTNSLHRRLEAELAQWHRKDAGLLFNSCYLANETAISTLAQQLPNCEIFSDAGNHASIIQGIRLSKSPKFIFRHNDPEHLEELLSKSDRCKPKLVIFESVHSMTGDISPMKQLCDVAHKYGALTFIDEVHAIGLYGDTGAGIAEMEDIIDHVDFISGTLAKAAGNIGGYIVGDREAIDTLRSYCPGFIFTTSLPPATVAGCLTSVNILRGEEGKQLRSRLHSNVATLFNKLRAVNIPAVKTPSHIIPVHVGNAEECLRASNDLLLQHNVYVQSINYPTVPVGQEQLRVTTTPLHTEEMMDYLVDSIRSVWKQHNIPFLWSVCNKYDNCYCTDESATALCRYQTYIRSRYRPSNLAGASSISIPISA